LTKDADTGGAESFLLTPDANIGLGARWFADELLSKQNNNLLWALMAHNAGPGAVARWKKIWRRLGRLDDYDFMTETARFEETQGFTRRALTAYWLSAAMQMFERSK
jgi:soluble lytic murein transglycosylase